MDISLVAQNTAATNWRNSRRSLQQHLFFLLQNRCKSITQLAQIHAHVITSDFSGNNSILVKLLNLYTVFNSFSHAHQLFDQLENRNNTSLWNQIIRGHSLNGNSRKSIELFSNMGRSQALPDGYTYTFVVNSCSKGGLFREGEQVHGKVLKSVCSSNIYVSTSLVDFYVKCAGEDGIKKAMLVFDEMPHRNVVAWNSLLFGCFQSRNINGAQRVFDEMPERNVVSWTTMISGCVQNGKYKEALTLFHNMREEQTEFDQVTLLAVLSACAELGDLDLGKWIHSYIVEYFAHIRQPVRVKLNNTLIHMYASCGELDAALAVFRGMKKRTTVSWTNMISGFAKQGYGDKALSMFEWMISMNGNDARPDEVTFLGVLSACSHSGLVNEGQYYFSSMTKTWGIEPGIEHFGSMVDLYSRAGLLDEAHELIKSMPMKPNDAVWGALLGGCRIYKNVEYAPDVADWLTLELDPDSAAGYLVLLSNVYAAAKRWKDVVEVRRKMVDMKSMKPRGQSWIQIDGSIYEFVAGDRSFENAILIYDVLHDVTREARLLGYVQYFADSLVHIEGELKHEVEYGLG